MTVERRYHLAVSSKKNAKRWPQKGPLTWSEFLEWLDVENPSNERECGGYVPALFEDDIRDLDHVKGRSMLTLDADEAGPTFLDDVHRVLEGHAYVVHTTWRNETDGLGPRYRLIVPQDRDVRGDTYTVIHENLKLALGAHWGKDKGCPTAERFMWRPSTQDPETYRYEIGIGPPIRAVHWRLPPEAREIVQQQLSVLDYCEIVGDAPGPDHPGAPRSGYQGWDDATFQVACWLIRLANSDWSEYRMEDAEDDFHKHAPRDAEFGDRLHSKKWASAQKQVGSEPVPDPRPDFDPLDQDTEPVPENMLPALLPPPEKPYRVARALTKLLPGVAGQPRWRWHQGDPYEWMGSRWGQVPLRSVETLLAAFLDRCSYEKKAKGATLTVPWPVTPKTLGDVIKSLSVLNNVEELENGAPGELLCRNGILDLRTGELTEHSPARFNTMALDVDYDPDADCPEWDKLTSVWFGGDPIAEACHHYWMFYVLSGRTDLQKAYLLYGPPRSGKGTMAHVLERLVGSDLSTATQLDMLGTQFGKTALLGKAHCLVGDAGSLSKGRAGAVVETLKGIIGNDTQVVPRKYRDDWVGTIDARFTILTNTELQLPDSSAAIITRLVVNETVESFVGREDPTLLEKKLLPELSGILNRVLEHVIPDDEVGWQFPETIASVETRKNMRAAGAPVETFLEEHLEVTGEPEDWVLVSELRDAYNDWAVDNADGEYLSPVRFGMALRSVRRSLRAHSRWLDGVAQRVYEGVQLKGAGPFEPVDDDEDLE